MTKAFVEQPLASPRSAKKGGSCSVYLCGLVLFSLSIDISTSVGLYALLYRFTWMET